jgi:CO/xanthine dehydrogenase FAD-binding subunit
MKKYTANYTHCYSNFVIQNLKGRAGGYLVMQLLQHPLDEREHPMMLKKILLDPESNVERVGSLVLGAQMDVDEIVDRSHRKLVFDVLERAEMNGIRHKNP